MNRGKNRREFLSGAIAAGFAMSSFASAPVAPTRRKLLKRSQVNATVKIAKRVFADLGMRLPPFAFMTPADWERVGHEYDEIRDCNLGWDVTDFGMEDFAHYGRCLFMLRNGKNNAAYPKPYAEKFILDPEGQCAPEHFHKVKREDIINRGGGTLVFELYNRRGKTAELADTPVTLARDGELVTVGPGEKLRLEPGESITLEPNVFHAFYAAEGADVMIGEVSSVNDDLADNVFFVPQLRFPVIEEDEAPYHLLVGDY